MESSVQVNAMIAERLNRPRTRRRPRPRLGVFSHGICEELRDSFSVSVLLYLVSAPVNNAFFEDEDDDEDEYD
jgi:hypothetical protein